MNPRLLSLYLWRNTRLNNIIHSSMLAICDMTEDIDINYIDLDFVEWDCVAIDNSKQELNSDDNCDHKFMAVETLINNC